MAASVFAMPSEFDFVLSEAVMPRPRNTSWILPTL